MVLWPAWSQLCPSKACIPAVREQAAGATVPEKHQGPGRLLPRRQRGHSGLPLASHRLQRRCKPSAVRADACSVLSSCLQFAAIIPALSSRCNSRSNEGDSDVSLGSSVQAPGGAEDLDLLHDATSAEAL